MLLLQSPGKGEGQRLLAAEMRAYHDALQRHLGNAADPACRRFLTTMALLADRPETASQRPEELDAWDPANL
jgi:hypothetical protein